MTTPLNLRVSSDLRDMLDDLAKEKNMSTSEVTRLILENYFTDESDFEEEEKHENFKEEEFYREKEEYYRLKYEELLSKELGREPAIWQSPEFLQLVFWILEQRSLPIQFYTNSQQENFRKTIIKINIDNLFSEDLKREFNKVLADLLKVENNFLLGFQQLDFSKKENFGGFNYIMLREFLFDKNFGLIKISI